MAVLESPLIDIPVALNKHSLPVIGAIADLFSLKSYSGDGWKLSVPRSLHEIGVSRHGTAFEMASSRADATWVPDTEDTEAASLNLLKFGQISVITQPGRLEEELSSSIQGFVQKDFGSAPCPMRAHANGGAVPERVHWLRGDCGGGSTDIVALSFRDPRFNRSFVLAALYATSGPYVSTMNDALVQAARTLHLGDFGDKTLRAPPSPPAFG